jgi:predicted TIM-barrel fold metal-dependent hydrolase
MTVNNDRSYFQRNPQYHMFLHPEYPSHEELMAARDRLIEKFPEMRFVGAHLGSLEWDVDVLAQRLDQFENMAVDVAARVPHLQFQSQLNREKVRDFMIRYQDRIIYATDRGISANAIPEEARKSLHDQWVRDWKYFATDEQMTVDEVDGQFQGLMLPREVIDKLYRENAIRWFRIP